MQGRATRSDGLKRLALLAFALLFLALFAGFAVGQGIGHPSVPAGDVAIVEDVPDDISTISDRDFERAIAQQAAQGGLKKAPKEGSEQFEELKDAALGELLDIVWIQGEAEELGISVTQKEIDAELQQIKEQNFAEKGSYAKFLEESGFTQEDVDKRVKLQLLSSQIQETINRRATKPSAGQIDGYYDAEKDTLFTTQATRDVRVISNSKERPVENAKAELAKDNSPAAWKRVAREYSDDPTTKIKGGLQPGLTEEFLQEPLKQAVFDNPVGKLLGPLEVEGKYMLVEVVKLNPAKVQSLDEARDQIRSTLEQQIQQEHFTDFIADFQAKWTSRTFCAQGFVIERCANYVGDGRPANAAPACYEADPKTPASECPALVTPANPALPGTVTPAKPQGTPLPQRPRPVGLEPLPEPAA